MIDFDLGKMPRHLIARATVDRGDPDETRTLEVVIHRDSPEEERVVISDATADMPFPYSSAICSLTYAEAAGLIDLLAQTLARATAVGWMPRHLEAAG